MFCPSCGNQNPENATQCGRCGAQLQGAPKPQKFKGTMMMSSSADLIAPGIGAVPGAPASAFAQTDRNTSPDDMLDAPTIMQAPGEVPGAAYLAQRAALTQPHGTSNVNATMAMDASAFGQIGSASVGPSSIPPAETGASTLAVDASAFGLGGPYPPTPPSPGAWNPPQAAQAAPPPAQAAWNAPQAPAPQPPPPQPEISTGGVASTVAVDISQFGLGGAGPSPNPYGAPPGPQGPQGFGGYPQPGMQMGMQPGMQPGMQSGMQSGMQMGMQPGMQQGWQGQGMAPLQPPPPSVAPSGGGKGMMIGVIVLLMLVLMGAGAAFYFMRH